MRNRPQNKKRKIGSSASEEEVIAASSASHDSDFHAQQLGQLESLLPPDAVLSTQNLYQYQTQQSEKSKYKGKRSNVAKNKSDKTHSEKQKETITTKATIAITKFKDKDGNEVPEEDVFAEPTKSRKVNYYTMKKGIKEYVKVSGVKQLKEYERARAQKWYVEENGHPEEFDATGWTIDEEAKGKHFATKNGKNIQIFRRKTLEQKLKREGRYKPKEKSSIKEKRFEYKDGTPVSHDIIPRKEGVGKAVKYFVDEERVFVSRPERNAPDDIFYIIDFKTLSKTQVALKDGESIISVATNSGFFYYIAVNGKQTDQQVYKGGNANVIISGIRRGKKKNPELVDNEKITKPQSKKRKRSLSIQKTATNKRQRVESNSTEINNDEAIVERENAKEKLTGKAKKITKGKSKEKTKEKTKENENETSNLDRDNSIENYFVETTQEIPTAEQQQEVEEHQSAQETVENSIDEIVEINAISEKLAEEIREEQQTLEQLEQEIEIEKIRKEIAKIKKQTAKIEAKTARKRQKIEEKKIKIEREKKSTDILIECEENYINRKRIKINAENEKTNEMSKQTESIELNIENNIEITNTVNANLETELLKLITIITEETTQLRKNQLQEIQLRETYQEKNKQHMEIKENCEKELFKEMKSKKSLDEHLEQEIQIEKELLEKIEKEKSLLVMFKQKITENNLDKKQFKEQQLNEEIKMIELEQNNLEQEEFRKIEELNLLLQEMNPEQELPESQEQQKQQEPQQEKETQLQQQVSHFSLFSQQQKECLTNIRSTKEITTTTHTEAAINKQLMQ